MSATYKVFIKSYGCQMNVYDSERMADFFISNGSELVQDYTCADLVILNTCCIREKAEDKLYSDLGRIKPFKEKAVSEGRIYVIVVAGCIAQLRKIDIAKKSKCVDIILGPQMVQHIFDCVEDFLKIPYKNREVISLTKFNSVEKFEKFGKAYLQRDVSAFITIQEGCNNFCTYCVVPHTRGREFSRPVSDILNEIKDLCNNGVKEIMLIGQNVNSYLGIDENGNECSLANLTRRITGLQLLKRIRYGTCHPKDVTSDLIEAYRDIDVLMPSFHLPVQSGSNSILKAMNRPYTIEEYEKSIEMLKNVRPDIAISSDFIVGFPGETDSDFQKTIDLVDKMCYAQGYSFKYSPRPNTKAAIMENQVSENIKTERLSILQELLNKKQSEFNYKCVGRTLNVLFAKKGRHEGQLVGKTPYHQAVSVYSENKYEIRDIADVKIISTLPHSLFGELA